MIRRQLAEAVATLGQHWPALTKNNGIQAPPF